MAEQLPPSEPQPADPAEARAFLRWVMEQLSDEEAMALCRLICSWVVEGNREQPRGEQ